MRITINQGDGVVGVDGVFRRVDLSEIASEVHAIQYDTVAAEGIVEFDASVTVSKEVRDSERENTEWAEARAAEIPEAEIDFPPRYMNIDVHRPPERFTDFAPYQVYLDRWTAAAPTPPSVEQLRASALAAIDAKTDQVRRRYITSIAGQEATYLIKERQAEAFKAAGYVGAVPAMVQAEATATGMSAQQATDAVLAERDFWVNVKAPAIELERRRGKIAASAAGNAEAIDAARNAAVAALDLL